ncbi:MAG: nucleotidyltransferase domain-containing protein [Pseudomonadota bacterium]
MSLITRSLCETGLWACQNRRETVLQIKEFDELSLVVWSSNVDEAMCRDIQEVLDEVIRRVVPQFHPKRIILFGSYAGGQPGPDSDLDLLIVMDVEGSLRRKANEIDMLLADRNIPMDLIVMTPEQYERQKNISGSIARQVEREGKVIYEHAA